MTQTNRNMEFTNRAQAKKLTNLSYLGGCGTSSKIEKNSKVLNIDTYILYLAPWKQSGYQVCSMASPECIKGCLSTSGHNGMEINSGKSAINDSRIKKTRMLFENRDFFMNWLFAEIQAAKNLSETKGNQFAVRLNGTSDLNWNAFKINGKTLFELFPDTQFYDYTKVPNRFNKMPKNYHLTFSYTGRNWSDCETLLNKGHNVAVVFEMVKRHNSRPENIQLPAFFKGYEVVDGDITDYRPFDKKGVIVGLHWKNIANKTANKEILNSVFVVKKDDNNCTWDKKRLQVA